MFFLIIQSRASALPHMITEASLVLTSLPGKMEDTENGKSIEEVEFRLLPFALLKGTQFSPEM